MYAGKNKSKNSKARSIATSEESLKLSSTDSRYDAGDYEAVPASIRKVRDARRKEQQEKYEEENALPASEIIAQQEAEIARLKEQVEKNAQPQTMADKYKSALDDGEHPTFKNPESMADFGDYEAVAASARPGAESRDPDQKVFRAKPSVKTRQVAKPSDLSDGSYEAVAAGARHAAPPEEPEQDEEPETRVEPVAEEPSFSREVPEYTAPSAEPEPEYTEPEYTAPAEPEPEPEPAPRPAPAPVSAADYTIQAYEEKEAQPTPAPAPVSAADYTVQAYTAREPEPVKPAVSSSDYIHRETYTPPAARNTASSPSGSGYVHSEPYVPPAQKDGGSFTRQSGRNIASVNDLAPGDYEAVAVSSADDSDMDLADGSYDFDKYLANAPTLQMHAEPEVSPEELAWQDLSDYTAAEDEPDITDEQTRALAEALAQETLSNQPGMQFEDIIDNVIAKVMEKKKAEEAAKAEENKPEEPQKEPEPEQPEQTPAPQEPQNKPEPEPQKEEPQPEPVPVKHSLEPDCIPDDTPLEDIPALIVAELDSIDGEVTDDDIHKTIDAVLISRLTKGELTLDSVQSARSSIMSEIKEMQEEEARILAELSGEKHEFRTDFLPHDIALEDIPDAVIAELDKVEGEVSDDDVKKSIDTVLIAKLADGELTLDSYQSSRDEIFDALGIDQPEAEPAEEPEEKPEEPEETPVEEPVPDEQTEPETDEEQEVQPEEAEEVPVEEPVPEEQTEPETDEEQEVQPEKAEEVPVEEPVPEEQTEPETDEEPVEAVPEEDIKIDTQDVEYTIDTPEMEVAEEPEEAPAAEEPEETLPEEESPSESEEDKEEEEEETGHIPVPKEPTVLEYDPYADKFVNPEPEPLSAAAVIAMQNQDEAAEEENEEETELEEEPEETVEVAEEAEVIPEEVPEETAEEPEEIPPEEKEEEPEEKPAVESEHEEESVGMQMTFDDIFRNPFVNDFEPLEVEQELHDEAEQKIEAEPEQEPAPESEEVPEEAIEESDDVPAEEPAEGPAEESEPESVEEPAEEPAPDEQPEQETEEEPEPQKEPEPEQEQEPEPETEIEEKIEIDDIFDVPTDEPADETNDEPEPDNADEGEAEEAAQAVEQAEEEARAKAEAEAKAKTEENLQKYGVDFVSEETSAEEQDDYSEAKAMRHEDMQNALLMAMVDGSDTSFCETVNKLMEKGDLNARTLRSRMPIDKEELNKVLSDPDHKPDKKTAIAICFALRLTWEDSVRLLYKAGHVLSDSSRYDLTIEYLMRRGVYDQNMINSVLRGSGLDGFGIPKSEI